MIETRRLKNVVIFISTNITKQILKLPNLLHSFTGSKYFSWEYRYLGESVSLVSGSVNINQMIAGRIYPGPLTAVLLRNVL